MGRKKLLTFNNVSALKNTSDFFYINGDWRVDWPRMFPGAGTVFNYERLDGQPETIHSLGPTTEDVVFMVSQSTSISIVSHDFLGCILKTDATSVDRENKIFKTLKALLHFVFYFIDNIARGQ